jgi:formylglycine-generating enzyme required for sulfatase activity
MDASEEELRVPSSERWDRLAGLFERSLALNAEERSAFLVAECAGDQGLRLEVEQLLEAREGSGTFLDPPRPALGGSRDRRDADVLLRKRIGSYRVLGIIASGGMGTVYDAEQERPRRRVALKMMRYGQTPSAARRFHYESEILARLKHPGIAQIYEVGIHVENVDGASVEMPWFAMERVDGAKTLIEHARERGLGLEPRLELILDVCAAIGHGHEKGVIHRDIKPSNLLVDSSSRVKVIDFGVARAHGTESSVSILVTHAGELIGTFQYMSPEQIEGDTEALDVRSDVYAIGLVLYEMLCGRLPYELDGLTLSAVARTICENPPTPPRMLRPDLPRELSWIALRALEKDPKRRYESASDLADDIRRFLAHEPVLAGPPSRVYRMRKFVRRHAVIVTAAILGFVALVIGILGLGIGMGQAVQARNLATRKAEDVLSLSAIQELKELTERADDLWPALPPEIPAYDRWLADAKVLIDGREADPEREIQPHPSLKDHEAKLAEIRLRARPITPEQVESDRRASPVFAEWDRSRSRLTWLRRMLGREPWPDEAEVEAGLANEAPPEDAAGMIKSAWSLLGTDPPTADTSSAVVYGNEIKALVLAKRAVAAANEGQRAASHITLAWALCRCGRFEAALTEAQSAAEEENSEQIYDWSKRLEGVVELWKENGKRTERIEECAKLSARVADLESDVEQRRTFDFEDAQERWWCAQLTQLVTGLKEFTDERRGGLYSSGTSAKHGWGIVKRAEFAKSIAASSVDGPQARSRWDVAIAAIASHPKYGGLKLSPQSALLPISEDPDSRLWEFAHLQTGAPAERGADGKLVLKEDTGLVFVLIPGGSFWMGAQATDPKGRNFDPSAAAHESPVKRMTLDPYFLSKYEMTQGQWARFTGNNPSNFLPGLRRDGNVYGLLNPVDQVTWGECNEALRRLALTLPTEAQWERGARGGTETAWWTGDDKRELAGATNLADASSKRGGRPSSYPYEDWLDDGWGFTAPIGSYRANPFGLHDVVGNVSEWCRDYYGTYDLPTRDGDGERIVTGGQVRVIRGGNFNELASDARSAGRFQPRPETVSNLIGLRPARRVDP